jgi:phage-related protein
MRAIVKLPLLGAIPMSSDSLQIIISAIAQLPVRLGMIVPVTQAILSSMWASITTTFYNIRSEISIWASGMTTSLSATWASISAGVSGAWSGIVATVSGAIQGFVSAIQGGMDSAASAVSSTMQSIVSSVQGIAGACYAAGANIVQSIANGIMAGIGAVRDAGAAVASAVSNFLPHSPPKEGPLRDIMSVGGRIVNIIANGIVPNPISAAMNSALSPVDPSMMAIASGASRAGMMQPAGASSTVINYNPTINMGGNQNEQGFKQLLNSHKDELGRMLQEMDRQKARVAYS